MGIILGRENEGLPWTGFTVPSSYITKVLRHKKIRRFLDAIYSIKMCVTT